MRFITPAGWAFGSGAAATGLILFLVFRAHARDLRVFRHYRPAIAKEEPPRGLLEKLA